MQVGNNKNRLKYFCADNLNFIDLFHTFQRVKGFLWLKLDRNLSAIKKEDELKRNIYYTMSPHSQQLILAYK